MKRCLLVGLAAILIGIAVYAADEGNVEATVSTSTATAISARLSNGYKLIYCTTATHYHMGGSAVTAATTDLPIPATAAWQVYVSPDTQYIAFILDSSTGTCTIYRQNAPPGQAPPAHATAPINGNAISPSSISVSGYTAGQDAGYNNVSATANFFTADTNGSVRFNGVSGAGFTYGGAGVTQTTGTSGLAVLGTLQGQGNLDIRGDMRNAGTGANCSSNTGAVCVNDTGGFCVADGSGATVACISSAGLLTSTNIYDYTLSANPLALTGTPVVQEFGALAANSTFSVANWTPQIVGIGGGNFVSKVCSDSACAATTYVTCTATCTATVGTPVACTINTSAIAKAIDPFYKITTACATSNPQGNFVAHLTQP